MHLALRGSIGAAALVGHLRQRATPHQAPKLRMHCLEHVTAEPARPLATGDSTPPCEAMPCGVLGGACARVGGARRRSTTPEPGRSEIGDQAPMQEPERVLATKDVAPPWYGTHAERVRADGRAHDDRSPRMSSG